MAYGKDWSDQTKAAHDLHYAQEEQRALFQQVKTLGTLAQQEQLPDLYLKYGEACIVTEEALKNFRKAKPKGAETHGRERAETNKASVSSKTSQEKYL